jgi:hypothetical protein
MGKKRNATRALVGKLEGLRQLGRPKRRWEDIVDRYDEVIWTGFI